MRRSVRRAAAALALLVLAGCGGTSGRFAALSSQSVYALGYPIEGARIVPDVAAEVVTHTILWIPTRTRPPVLQDAVDAALVRGGGNLMLNAEVEHWWVSVPFLYGQEGWRVRGDVVRSEEPTD
ncbi:MAG: hypothetical protein DCC71_16165 [Proteobacteria bacterium]|nr:MAG: hypothetical protein DCC71_16165 [Pseudomonadota bacterium]